MRRYLDNTRIDYKRILVFIEANKLADGHAGVVDVGGTRRAGSVEAFTPDGEVRRKGAGAALNVAGGKGRGQRLTAIDRSRRRWGVAVVEGVRKRGRYVRPRSAALGHRTDVHHRIASRVKRGGRAGAGWAAT